MKNFQHKIHLLIIPTLIAFCSVTVFTQNKLSDNERARNREMLSAVKSELTKHYYDKTFHGLDIEALFKQADESLKTVGSNSEAFYIIASFLASLDDSHTSFAPPPRSVKIDHGWTMQMIGDKCLVTQVKAGSDAAKKGLAQGDQILTIENFEPKKASFWKLQYLFYALNPMSEFNLKVRSPSGETRDVFVEAKRSEGKRVTDLTNYVEYMNYIGAADRASEMDVSRYIEIPDGPFILNMTHFDMKGFRVDDLMDKVSKHPSFILDLRGNGGGAEETLLRLIGNLFGNDIKVGQITGRKNPEDLIAKKVKSKPYDGKVVVLIDSESGSASEVFSRVMQLEKRGTVIGDVSAGAVMRSIFYPKTAGLNTVVFYGVGVTDADLIMTDGKSLEKIGVTPDEIVLPTPADLRARKDPVMARAAAIVGFNLTPEKAGLMFPYRWPE